MDVHKSQIEPDLTVLKKAAQGELRKTSETDILEAQAVVDSQSHELTKKELENENTRQNIALRRSFGWTTFALVAIWMMFTMRLLYYVAFNEAKLTDAVLIALITTTLATVIGLLWLVLAYLFPKNDKV